MRINNRRKLKNRKRASWDLPILLIAFLVILGAIIFSSKSNIHSESWSGKEFKQAPFTFSKEKRLELEDFDDWGRAVNAHIFMQFKDKPQEEREERIGWDPVGWHNFRFFYIAGDGKRKKAWLMNRGHLVGYQFSGLNDEPRNLVPETAYLNQGNFASMNSGNDQSMLFYESKLANWLENNPQFYLDYQVTPLYHDDELIPRKIRLSYIGFDERGRKIKILLDSPKERDGTEGTTVVYLDNSSSNAEIDYLTGTAENIIP
jgi:DNA-entry nuclease